MKVNFLEVAHAVLVSDLLSLRIIIIIVIFFFTAIQTKHPEHASELNVYAKYTFAVFFLIESKIL